MRKKNTMKNYSLSKRKLIKLNHENTFLSKSQSNNKMKKFLLEEKKINDDKRKNLKKK